MYSMRRVIKEEEFWITNISRKAVHLADIGVIIYPMRSINLLDSKHYNITKEQLDNSRVKGSLFARSNMVVVRAVAPEAAAKKYLPFKDDAIFPTKQRSAVEIENIKYEELDLPDDTYAEENADTAQADHLGKWNNK